MGKRIAIATIGTEGDVQPFVALAVALQKQGHTAIIGTTSDFEPLVTGRGIEFHSIGSDIQAFVGQKQFDKAISTSVILYGPQLLAQGQKILENAAREVWQMAQGADAIVFHMNTNFAIDVAEALDVPAIMVAFQPLTRTGEFPYFAFDVAEPFDPLLNKLSYVVRSAQQSYYDLPRNRLRDTLLGLGPRKHSGFAKDNQGESLPVLHAYSSYVSPRPKDWPRSAVITGFWQPEDDTNWEPSPEFRDFLERGAPPIYIGFGSMPFGARRNSRVVTDALRLWGGRAVVSKGWGGLISPGDLTDSVFAIPRAPHIKLFEYVDAVVHHGGAGTTYAGLYAGKPTLVLPQFFDQPYWGRRVYALGCGPEPIRVRKLTAKKLADALEDLSTSVSYHVAATEISRKLRTENGCERAVEVIEAVITQYPRQSESAAPLAQEAS